MTTQKSCHNISTEIGKSEAAGGKSKNIVPGGKARWGLGKSGLLKRADGPHAVFLSELCRF
ncbi:hypothetical protein E3J59_00765 [Candidatus Aerophobetes bacterium]|uniref:Uncharacterized protein n=1 Tax=Aerophobetes bacterium TaxID=2030807 RepID=A0A523V0J6_UNCAE|nr:MAG: hypothetical protein E3J59_00765 [Candidatus Aerophobetes bacterium]